MVMGGRGGQAAAAQGGGPKAASGCGLIILFVWRVAHSEIFAGCAGCGRSHQRPGPTGRQQIGSVSLVLGQLGGAVTNLES